MQPRRKCPEIYPQKIFAGKMAYRGLSDRQLHPAHSIDNGVTPVDRANQSATCPNLFPPSPFSTVGL